MVECDNLCTPSSSFTNNRREQYLAEMDHHMVDDITPTRILTIAIQKRREFVDQKEPNMRCELLNKSLIHHVCRTLGEHRSRKPSFIQQQRTGSTSKRRNRSSEDDDQGSKRFHVEEEEEEEEERLYVDDQAKEDFHHFLEEDDASSAYSMVHIELGGMNFDYNQIEKLLDEDQPVQYDYVRHWSPSDSLNNSTASSSSGFTDSCESNAVSSSPEVDALLRQLYRKSQVMVDPQNS